MLRASRQQSSGPVRLGRRVEGWLEAPCHSDRLDIEGAARCRSRRSRCHNENPRVKVNAGRRWSINSCLRYPSRMQRHRRYPVEWYGRQPPHDRRERWDLSSSDCAPAGGHFSIADIRAVRKEFSVTGRNSICHTEIQTYLINWAGPLTERPAENRFHNATSLGHQLQHRVCTSLHATLGARASCAVAPPLLPRTRTKG